MRDKSIINALVYITAYCDDTKGEWHMLMPAEVREALAASLPFFLGWGVGGYKSYVFFLRYYKDFIKLSSNGSKVTAYPCPRVPSLRAFRNKIIFNNNKIKYYDKQRIHRG